MGASATFGLHQDVPACLGTSDNALITVGACNADGERTPETTRDLGRGGFIVTSAQGDGQVPCANTADSGSHLVTGTSFAAPQIAGLAAYFMSLPQADLPAVGRQFMGPDLHIRGQVSKAVRDYIYGISYKRFPARPNAVTVAYNGAEDGLCSVVPGTSLKRKRRGIQAQGDEYGLSPLVVSGVIDPAVTYPLPVCSLSPSSSTSSLASPSSASTTSSASVSSVSSASSTFSPPQTPTSATDPAGAGAGTALPVTGTFIPTPVPPRGHLPTATPSTSSAKGDDELPCFKCSDGDVIG
ncbi:hypothetical protein DL98DRAFT_246851 [Cadophora sp. DSE1049]|nr:hypothetical protein DL98DRAFT_246851 [Cadophora sp. DSE1049]